MIFRGQVNGLDGGCCAEPLDKPRFVNIGDSRLYKTFLSFTTNEDVAYAFAVEDPAENVMIKLSAPHDGLVIFQDSEHEKEGEARASVRDGDDHGRRLPR